MNDFQNRGGTFDPQAKAKRMELVNALRKSNLPPQHFDIPKSTAQDSYNLKGKNDEDALSVKQRKEDADKIVARVRGVKPNFTMGNHKLDYMSTNQGALKQPVVATFDKESLKNQVATQRQHNYKMSYEGGNQFDNAKSSSSPYKLQSKDIGNDRVAAKGSSNQHQVQIGNQRTKTDYQSLTQIQQKGHKTGEGNGNSRNNGSTFTEVREKIAEQTKDLRSSHFALGVDNTPAQASSAIMYTAPPTNALIRGTTEGKEARERIQRSNFTIKDVHGSQQPAKTTSQANNQIR